MEWPEPQCPYADSQQQLRNAAGPLELSVAPSNLPRKLIGSIELANPRCPAMELPEPQSSYADSPHPPKMPLEPSIAPSNLP